MFGKIAYIVLNLCLLCLHTIALLFGFSSVYFVALFVLFIMAFVILLYHTLPYYHTRPYVPYHALGTIPYLMTIPYFTLCTLHKGNSSTQGL